MFGYLFPTKSTLSLSERKIFRDYYCSICLAHFFRYGYIATLLNNYDIGVFAIVLNVYNDRILECGNCGKRITKKKEKFSAPKWAELVDLNINLVRKKMDDDIKDHLSGITILRKLPFLNIFNRCKKNNPDQFSVFNSEYEKFNRFESEKLNLIDILECYENFVRNSFGTLSYINLDHLELLVALNRWIYWIDAIEDYDKDKINQNYNPLHQGNSTVDKTEFLLDNIDRLTEFGEELEFSIIDAYGKCSYPRKSKIILDNIIKETVPQTTMKVLHKQPLEKKRRLL